MKKNLLLVTALLTTATLGWAQTKSTWNDATDINAAKGKAAYISLLHAGAVKNITDDNLNTSCQLNTNNDKVKEWVVVDLGYDYDISKIGIFTSGDRYDSKFSVYTAKSQDAAFADGTDALAGKWGEAVVTVDNSEQTASADKEFTYAFDKTVTARYIKYEADERPFTDTWGVTFREIKVAGTTNDPAVNVVKSIKLTIPSLVVGETQPVTVEKLNSAGSKITDDKAVTFTSSNPDIVEIFNGTNVVGKAIGTATVTATYSDDITATADVTVSKNWTNDDVLKDLNLTAQASSTREGGASSVIGQKAGSNWSSITPSEGDEHPWWLVDLGNAYDVKSIGIRWADCYAETFKVYTASSLKAGETAVGNDNIDWNTTTIEGTGVNNSVSTTDINTNNVRFIKIYCEQGGGSFNAYGMRFTNFYLEGDFTIHDLYPTVVAGKATCLGYFNQEKYDTIKANVIDLTRVKDVPETLTRNKKSPNALIYAPDGVTGPNVTVGGRVADLQLTDGKDFAPDNWKDVTNGTLTTRLEKGRFSIIYLPFGVSTIPAGVHLYAASSVSSNAISLTEVTTLDKEKAYFITADADGKYELKGENTQVGASTVDHETRNGGITIESTLVKATVPAGSWVFSTKNELTQIKSDNVQIPAFNGYITAGLETVNAAKVRVYVDNDVNAIQSVETEATATDAPAYNLNGQRINNNFKGIVIKNGKKAIIK